MKTTSRNDLVRLGKSTESDALEINLRKNCIDCKFFGACNVPEKIGSPDADPLVGSYRFSALKSRCVA